MSRGLLDSSLRNGDESLTRLSLSSTSLCTCVSKTVDFHVYTCICESEYVFKRGVWGLIDPVYSRTQGQRCQTPLRTRDTLQSIPRKIRPPAWSTHARARTHARTHAHTHSIRLYSDLLFTLLHYIWIECCSYTLHFAWHLAFLQQFISATKDVILPTSAHQKYYILCILPLLTQICQQGYFTWMWAP